MFCLSPFCYVCLRNKEELFNLNNIDGNLMRLWDKLLYCMPEIEDINEDIPLFICRACRRDLRVAYTFRKKFVTNFPYVDDYIRQLTYVDGLLLAVEDVEETEHADLCVTLVDFAKRFQDASSTIKIETSDSVVDSHVEIQSEQNDVFINGSDTENIPISSLSKRENLSTEMKENSNESFQLRSNWEILTTSTENPRKRRKLDDGVSITTEITDIQDDDIPGDGGSNSVAVKDDTGSLEEINGVCSKHDHNYNDLDGISSNNEVQKVGDSILEEQLVISEMPAQVSTLQESQNVDIHEELEFILVEHNNLLEESNKENNSAPSSSMEQGESETNTEPSIEDTTSANTLNQQQSIEKSNQDAADLQIICDHIPTSSNKNKDENGINLKGTTSKLQLNALDHPGNEMLNQPANSVEQTAVTQPADSKAVRPADSVTNALFKSIRNSGKTCADVDVSSVPSVATSMYESDIIEDEIDLNSSENSVVYISDNDDTSGCRQSVSKCAVSSTCRREYSDISSPDNTADISYESTSISHGANREIHQISSESGCGEPFSTTLVHIKHPVSDVEENYSNETVLYQDSVQTNTADSVTSTAMTSFSFMKAYLDCTERNISTDMNTASKNCPAESSQSEQITTDASTNSTDACCQKNQGVSATGEHLNNNQITTSSTQAKAVSAECKKNVYTSIRKKIPRLIDLNGSIRKNVTSPFEHFTTCNNKNSVITQPAYRLGNCQTSNSTNVQQELHKDSEDTSVNVQLEWYNDSEDSTSTNVRQEMHKVSTDTTSDSNNIPAKSTSETFSAVYKCTICDATFKYQSLLECHAEEKHSRRQELLPDIIVHDEQLIRNNRLATYRIPNLNRDKFVGKGEDRVDNTPRVEAVVDAEDTSQRRISVTENVEQTVMNKHKLGVDVATNTVNLLCTKDKLSTSMNTKVVLHKQHSASAKQQSIQVNNTVGDQLKLSEKRHKNVETKYSNRSVVVNVKSHKKHHRLSASCRSKKKHKCTGTNHSTTSRNRHAMVDKAIGTIDFTDNSTGIYAFTDAVEEHKSRIRADENSNHGQPADQSSRQQVDKVCAKVTNKVKPAEKPHRQPDIVHYYQTTEHLSVDGTKSSKKHNAKPTVQKVDKSTETGDQPAVNSVVNETVSSVGGSAEQPQAKVTSNISNDVDREPTKCSLCASTFADLNSLREHLIIQHKTYKKFQCTLCEKYFRQRCRLLYHMVNTHAKAQLHVCPVCDKNFSCTATLNRHQRSHYGDKPYKCTVCDKAFRYKESVKTHMVLHTGVKAYRCPYCDRTFAFKGNMLQHVQTHTRDKRYPCPMCDKDFCTNTVMKQHMRTHTGERPYKCPTCARTFTVRQTMVQHMSVHTDVKPYACTMCTARFKLKQHLRRHMYVHTEDKPYTCPVCDKAFRLQTELHKHAGIHDNTKQPYTCDVCNVGYSRRDKLYAHNFNVHYKKDINLVTLSKDST